MKINFITLFPDLIQSYLSQGLIGKAQTNKIMNFEIYNLRDQAVGSYKSVDDSVYGGADGALIQYEPLKKALAQIDQVKNSAVIYLSPQGKKLDQTLLKKIKNFDQLTLISGRYAGIDERFISKYVDLEISIGDYILSGGELPSLVLVEGLSRELSGVLGNPNSVVCDSFTDGLLEAPQYTKPSEIDGLKVPEVLTSGDHAKISDWKKNMSVLVTLAKRPDLIDSLNRQIKVINWKAVGYFYSSLSSAEKLNLKIENLESILEKYIE